MNLYLLQFNPYSNRTIKGYSTLAQYQDYVRSAHTGINFNPNDGVDTEIILNSPTDECDYAVLTDDQGAIVSRWFVMDGARTRVGQYRYTLRRDVIFDHLNGILNSTAYVTKGWCGRNDSAIYNKEQFPVNQIKQSEYLLKDKTKTPWIIGYLSSPDEGDDPQSLDVEWNVTYTATNITAAQYAVLSDPTSKLYNRYDNLVVNCPSNGTLVGGKKAVIRFNKQGRLSTSKSSELSVADWRTKTNVGGAVDINDCDALADRLYSNLYTTYFDSIVTALVEAQYPNKYSSYSQFRNQVVAYDGHYYRVSFVATAEEVDQDLENTSDVVTRIYNALRLSGLVQVKPTSPSTVPVDLTYTTTYYRPVVEEVVNKYSATIPDKDTLLRLSNQPYAMFAMPYQDLYALGTELPEGGIQCQGTASQAIAQGLSRKFSGSGALHDIQLLPYCPLLDYVGTTAGGTMTFMNMDLLPIGGYTEITHTEGESTSTVGYIYWCTKDTFTFNIDFSLPASDDPISFKIQQQTKMARLCSPNYSGVFEFSPTSNSGVQLFNVDCTYKPYSPYIHLNPDFGGLYGRDFNDARGLICGGDFSLPQVNDAWETYQIQNKNYSNSFDREVQSLELQNRYALGSDIASAAVGSLQGGLSGGMIGSAIGNPVGAGIGAAVGATLSAGAGVADVIINKRLREEQLDLKKDLYGYSIQNIQALPNTLTKVGALNANNKLWPFVEIYGCLEDEALAFQRKLEYNGFTINKIDLLAQYWPDDFEKDFYQLPDYWFIQARLIRTDIHEDWHMIRSINDELETGVYL